MDPLKEKLYIWQNETLNLICILPYCSKCKQIMLHAQPWGASDHLIGHYCLRLLQLV